MEEEQKTLAAQIISQISVHHFSALFNRIAIRYSALPEIMIESGIVEVESPLCVGIGNPLSLQVRACLKIFMKFEAKASQCPDSDFF